MMAQLLPVNLGKRLAAAGWATAQIWANESGQLAAFSVAAPSKTAQLIKQLRERSGSPISDVKSCLEACNWDADAAYDALRKKGLAAAAKKSSRHASEGLVGCLAAPNGQVAVIVEVNSETDFVARNDLFQRLVGQVAAAALALPAPTEHTAQLIPLEQLMAARLPGEGPSVAGACADVAAHVRENVKLRRAYRLASETGHVSAYVHQSSAPGLGRIACLVSLEPADGKQLSQEARHQVDVVGRQLAMHAAGMKSQFLKRADVPPELLDKEKAILAAQAAGSGKPPAVVDKMVQGRLSKYFEEVVLLEQRFLLDDSLKVQDVVARLSKALDLKLQLTAFTRVQCGEGIEQEQKDFAKEVASALGQ